MVRDLQPEDLGDAVALLEILRLNTPYRGIVPDWERVINTMVSCSDQRNGMGVVAEHDGKLTGIMLAMTHRLWWVDQKLGAKIASDLVFYSQRYGDGRQMLKRMVIWAFAQPCVVRIEMGVSSGQAPLEVMRRLYERSGFTLEGSLFVRNHPRYHEALNGQMAA